MRLHSDDNLRFSATDLAGYLACKHLTGLRLAKARGLAEPPTWHNPVADAIRERGEEHERQYLAHLVELGLEVVDLAGHAHTDVGVEKTREAMRGGAAVIAQARLGDGGWVGIADVLRRIERPSTLGEWSYEVEDTKLARETAGGTILQLCLYSELLAGLQGAAPEWMHVVAPGRDFEPFTYRVADYAAYYRHVRERFLAFLRDLEAGSGDVSIAALLRF
mgnify:FL=1